MKRVKLSNKHFLDYFPPAIVEGNQKRKKCPELRERSEGGANRSQKIQLIIAKYEISWNQISSPVSLSTKVALNEQLRTAAIEFKSFSVKLSRFILLLRF